MKENNSLERTKLNIVPVLIWMLVVFTTWTFMHRADHLLQFTPDAMGKYYPYRWIIIMHITAGGGSLALGIIQFWKKLRTYSWQLHRVIGFLYLLAVLTSSSCAIVLACTTSYEVNIAYAFSLQVWAAVWISATALAYYFALRKKFVSHQEWMIRSYIVTIAFVVSGLALRIPFISNMGSFGDISPAVFWFGWSVSLYLYEVIRSSKTAK